jgi:hypothetical protein
MSQDIVERLVAASYALPAQGEWTDPPNNVCTEGAAEIKRLQALIVERVTSELRTLERAHDAEAEVEQLRRQTVHDANLNEKLRTEIEELQRSRNNAVIEAGKVIRTLRDALAVLTAEYERIVENPWDWYPELVQAKAALAKQEGSHD